MEHPQVYRKVQKEIDNFYEINVSSDQEITYTQCLSLSYFQAVIKEAGRIHPSIVYQIPRYVPQEGIKIAGYDIPSGTAAGISALAFNRSRKIFGQDADEFRPERWIDDEPRARLMDSYLATVH
jgi:cytochrome P450